MRSLFTSMVVAASSWSTVASGAQVTYQFTTTVQIINHGAPGFPAQLNGVNVGDVIVGTFSYETTSPPGTNNFPNPYSLATYYTLTDASFSFTIDGVVMSSWSGVLGAFVWNNDVIFGNLRDGLIFSNITSQGSLQYQLGNIGLPTTTFASELLPLANVPGSFLLELSPAGGSLILRSNAWQTLTLVTPCAEDIAPPSGDGSVNVSDLLAVINAWGACPAPCSSCNPDINDDCHVNVTDLLAVINNWGPCP